MMWAVKYIHSLMIFPVISTFREFIEFINQLYLYLSSSMRTGIDWLLEMGFDDASLESESHCGRGRFLHMPWQHFGAKDSKKADVVALTLAEIMNRKLAPWPTLQQCFAPFLGRLSDMMIHGSTPTVPS